ncbi:lipoprotein BA_5634 family protein [Brevibacillus halotolerans]|uniref:lipoprotein BA_5634 family protein n=1 Tax=Brevibacillus TaxID=55080 RepID=UPI00215D24A7|nr:MULTISPECIES: lipoprotein BA_5634 family protein [Brevibacillus]MCR8963331.1 lipoprotein BA_5634 family protein [Brevibacillus laterosporus]MCZ0835487.1 lipoprotein BA_5634 family protein [Brevibacillus halotolerans]
MRKIINICVIAAVLFGVYLTFIYKEPRNGILMFGDKQALQDIKNEHNSEIKSVDLYKVKTTKSDKNSVFIMDQKTAEDVIKKGILRKESKQGFAASDPIQSLPKITNGEAVLFTDKKNENLKKIAFDGKEIPVRYDSNTWFGHDRFSEYDEFILIVDNSTFNQIPSKETYMGIFTLNKVYGKNNGVVDTNDAKQVQTEKEFMKLTESRMDNVHFIKGLSILE